MSTVVIYIITAAFGVALALLLARFAGLSFRAKVQPQRAASRASRASLRTAVSSELGALIGSQEKREEIAKALENLVSQEVEQRTTATVQELSKKYEKVIRQKTQNEEFAWAKYKKTLTEKKGTDAVIRSIAQGLVVVDSEGKVIMMNPAAEKLLETQKKEKIGKPVQEGLREEQLISLVKNPGAQKDREIELISQEDETKKTLRASSAVIENENGQTVGMVSVLSDVTKQKEIEKMKSSFVANVTHELRTPLITIDKSIALLRSQETGPVSETQEQFLSIAERNIRRLGRLINDLLDLSKLEAGKMKLEPQLSSIEKIINESVENFEAWAGAKSITVQKNVDEGIPELTLDPHRITQVITNLVGNAIKFTPEKGTVTLKARYDKDKQEVVVSVADNGIGIPQLDLPKIFDKFYQTGERAPTDISGTGLGLSICKEIVELHQGRIWAESEEQKGATFSFALPLQKNDEEGGGDDGETD